MPYLSISSDGEIVLNQRTINLRKLVDIIMRKKLFDLYDGWELGPMSVEEPKFKNFWHLKKDVLIPKKEILLKYWTAEVEKAKHHIKNEMIEGYVTN